MKKPQAPKKHHFVPECYLKNFMIGKDLYVLDIDKVQKGFNEFPKKAHPARICYLEDYYKITPDFLNNRFRLDGYNELFIETTVLTRLERKYGSLYRKLTIANELTRSEATDLCDFIIQLKLRNPYHLSKTLEPHKEEWIESSIANIAEEGMANPRFAGIPEKLRQVLVDIIKEENKQDPNFSKLLQLSSLVERGRANSQRNEAFRSAMMNSLWILLAAPPGGPRFITCDNPGVALSTTKERITYNTKFKDGFHFYFPLSPDFCFMITDRETDNCYTGNQPIKYIAKVDVESDFVHHVNNTQIQIRNKLLIAGDNWYLSQIASLNKSR